MDLDYLIDGGLNDARIREIGWSDTSSDLWIKFFRADDPPLMVIFSRITHLSIALDFGIFSEMPLIWDSSFERIDHSKWSVSLDFGGTPEGEIMFQCNDMQIEEEHS